MKLLRMLVHINLLHVTCGTMNHVRLTECARQLYANGCSPCSNFDKLCFKALLVCCTSYRCLNCVCFAGAIGSINSINADLANFSVFADLF